MKLFCIVAVAAALFTTAVQADLSQLAAVLPPCAVGIPLLMLRGPGRADLMR